MDSWTGISPAALTGFGAGAADQGSGGVTTGVETAAATRTGTTAPLYSPDNPLFWVAVLLLATTGLITFSTSVKVGPAKGSVSI